MEATIGTKKYYFIKIQKNDKKTEEDILNLDISNKIAERVYLIQDDVLIDDDEYIKQVNILENILLDKNIDYFSYDFSFGAEVIDYLTRKEQLLIEKYQLEQRVQDIKTKLGEFDG